MSRFMIAAGIYFPCMVFLTAAPVPKKASYLALDLQPKGNHNRTETMHGYKDGKNDLSELKKGKHNLSGIPFEVGDKLIVLGSKQVAGMPEKVEGLAVKRRVEKLHFLHAAGYKTVENDVIGKYVVQYENGRQVEIEIVYGKDVHDWWTEETTPKVTRGKIAWEGKNEAVSRLTIKTSLQLFLTTWTNPTPQVKVDHIDYVSLQTDSAPFCVAITAEVK